MTISHLINGKRVDSAQRFETVNPSTQAVLAEVARGGADEVNAAVAAAKAAFPAWAAHPVDAPPGRADRPACARTGPHRKRRHRPGHQPDRQAAGAACGRQFSLLCRDVHPGGRPHLPHAHAPELHSQNVRDLRQPFGGTKTSGTGREGGSWSYEVFLEPKNEAVSLGRHHIPHWGV